jgi:hypothetical protein
MFLDIIHLLFFIRNSVSDTGLSPKRRICKQKTGQWITARNIIFVLMYHHHKLLDRN